MDLKQNTKVRVRTHNIVVTGKIVGIALLGIAPFGRYYIIKLDKKIDGYNYNTICEYANKITVIDSKYKRFLNLLLLTFKSLVNKK